MVLVLCSRGRGCVPGASPQLLCSHHVSLSQSPCCKTAALTRCGVCIVRVGSVHQRVDFATAAGEEQDQRAIKKKKDQQTKKNNRSISSSLFFCFLVWQQKFRSRRRLESTKKSHTTPPHRIDRHCYAVLYALVPVSPRPSPIASRACPWVVLLVFINFGPGYSPMP